MNEKVPMCIKTYSNMHRHQQASVSQPAWILIWRDFIHITESKARTHSACSIKEKKIQLRLAPQVYPVLVIPLISYDNVLLPKVIPEIWEQAIRQVLHSQSSFIIDPTYLDVKSKVSTLQPVINSSCKYANLSRLTHFICLSNVGHHFTCDYFTFHTHLVVFKYTHQPQHQNQ